MSPGGASFRLEAVSVRFQELPAVDGASLRVDAGEQVAFVGPSGSGKTTLLRLLNGTIRPGAGRVFVDGRDLATLSARELRGVRAQVGFIHQDLALVPNLRVSQNVLAGRLGKQGFCGAMRSLLLPARGELERAYGILERVGIPEKLFEHTGRLSGGQQQRVAIARALYQGPRALLADEPVSSVDPARARDTVDLLCQVSRERGLTLCMSLHNLPLARAFFPRLVGLRRGRVAFDRPAADLTDAEFHELYRLGREEMLDDGV